MCKKKGVKAGALNVQLPFANSQCRRSSMCKMTTWYIYIYIYVQNVANSQKKKAFELCSSQINTCCAMTSWQFFLSHHCFKPIIINVGMSPVYKFWSSKQRAHESAVEKHIKWAATALAMKSDGAIQTGMPQKCHNSTRILHFFTNTWKKWTLYIYIYNIYI